MPGYSGTPLPKKLGIKQGFRVCLVHAPADVRAELQTELANCEVPGRGPIDFAMVFTWVSWPKKTSGVATDVNENVVRAIGLAAGLVDVKVCAVTEIWSGLKFVRRLKDREKSR
jgi:hypothetical protein